MNKNKHNRRAVNFAKGLLAGTMLAVGGHAAAQSNALDLADRPLFTGISVEPNILVAVDDSGSMDYETLFPTPDGKLYWAGESQGFYSKSNDSYSTYGDEYVYLFPNGCGTGRRVYCGSKYAIPPLPQFAYARSPEFNTAYFDPNAKYKPWLGYDPATPSNAQYEPSLAPNLRLDLTKDVEKRGYGYEFELKRGMTIPAGIKYYHTRQGQPAYEYVCIKFFAPNYNANDSEIRNRECEKSGYIFFRFRSSTSKTQSGYLSKNKDLNVTQSEDYAISYFPATFYLESDNDLPANYGYTGDTLIGKAPDGSDMVGYEIKLDNFDTSAQYDAAIQNFANWFSYYRKRHLATRAGIVAAFDRISQVRVGQCTINQRDPLTMRSLEAGEDGQADRQSFYDNIFNIDFYRSRGTPNRYALRFLGEQLEENDNIITSPCQQNYAILFTDGYNDRGLNSNIGNADKNSPSNAKYGEPFGDNYSNTIADVAMHYYDDLGTLENRQQDYIARDQMRLPPGCDADQPDSSLDCQKDLHMVTFGVTLGQRGEIFGKPDKQAENRDPYANPPAWPDPNTAGYTDAAQIDDLWHATVNTRGKLLNAKTPVELADSFTAALERITAQSGSAGAVAASSGNYATDTAAYQAGFTAGSWKGSLKAYQSSASTSGGDPEWDAAKLLTDDTDPDQRVILTSIPGSDNDDPDYEPAAFRANALPNTFGELTQTLTSATTGRNGTRLGYIRGDRSQEASNGGTLRNRRNNILGDIVHSSPVYAGVPDRIRYPDQWQDKMNPAQAQPESAYSAPGSSTAFAQQNSGRTPMVYVGANDGMLHGFDADSGREKIAYVPGAVLPHLADLSDRNYIHRFFVDATPATGDVFYEGQWHTILVGGLRNGGRSVFALDITDPDQFAENNADDTVLWEYSDPQLGRTYGTPSIVRLHDGHWAAMFSSGYADADSGEIPEALYLLDAQNGTRTARIETGDNDAHGLTAPFPVDVDGDFITDYAYAGDLDGNIWKFDLTSSNPADWSASKLFTAEAKDDTAQPITGQPQVGFHPYGREYGVIVYFGTGKYLENGDAGLNNDARNSFYGVWDPGSTSGLSRDNLVEQKVIEETTAQGKLARVITDNPVHYKTGGDHTSNNDTPEIEGDGDPVYGWVLDLPDNTGELIVNNPQLRRGTVSFSTTIPSTQSCTAGGSGYFMVLDVLNGGRTGFPAFDLNGDNQFVENGANKDTVTITENGRDKNVTVSGIAASRDNGFLGGVTMLFDRDNKVDQAVGQLSSGDVKKIRLNPGLGDQRIGWREIRR